MGVLRKTTKAVANSKNTQRSVLVKLTVADLWDFATNPSRCSALVAVALLSLEIIVNTVVIQNVSYTEIDWIAYMQEVEVVIKNGTTDYSLVRGDTGPLVYPAGFVWIYSLLYYLTSSGTNVKLAQYVFAVVYLTIVALIFRLLLSDKTVPNLVLAIISCTSYRVHSICVLRLFNDPVAMLFLYAGINAFADGWWTLGSVLYSLAVSIKMNILLFAPALFLAYLATQGVVGTVKQLTVCVGVQLVLAYPFLSTHPISYLKSSFDLGRVFLFKWTVNWRFLPEEIFLHTGFHLMLLLVHSVLLLAMAKTWWTSLNEYANAEKKLKNSAPLNKLLLPLFTSNFIGMMCARSLHYQFYIWYYHQLQYLCWNVHSWPALPSSDVFRLLVLGALEMAWNTYPSTNLSSGLLHLCHLAIFTNTVLDAYRPGRKVPKLE